MIAASAKPDFAFQWIEEVFKTDQSIEALKDAKGTLHGNLTSLKKNKPSPEFQPEDVGRCS